MKQPIPRDEFDVNEHGHVQLKPCVTTAPQGLERPTSVNKTDKGMAGFFNEVHGADIRFAKSLGFIVWNGVRWVVDDQLLVEKKFHDLLHLIWRTVGDTEWQERWSSEKQMKVERDHLISLAKTYENNNKMKAAIEQLKPIVACKPDIFDPDPWLLNTLTGVIDLRDGKLYEHRRSDFITHLAPVEYDTEAVCPLWHQFITRIFDGNEALIQYVQRLMGFCLTGDISEQLLPIIHGGGANGKSVFLDTFAAIMGDYAAIAPESLLTVSNNTEHPTEIADLRGRRLVVASETEEGKRLRIGLVKRFTGDKTLKGRFMRKDYFEFARSHKTIMVTNNKPVVQESKNAMWRRLKLVPFDVTIPEAEQDKRLLEKLADEWSGILAWAVRGCLDWQKQGLAEPAEVKIATGDYRQEQNTVAEFVEDCCCTTSADAWTSRKVIRDVYIDHCKRAGVDPVDAQVLYSRLLEIPCGNDQCITEAYGTVGDKRTRGFRGISILSTSESR